jgi:hypothetical protein
MFVQFMLNMLFGIQNVNNPIDLIRVSTCKRYDFIVLSHLIQEMLSVRPKHIAFRLACSMAKNLDYIDNQCRPVINSVSKIRIGGDRKKGNGVMKI